MRRFCLAVLLALSAVFYAEAQSDARSMTPEQNYYRGRQIEASDGVAAAAPYYNEAIRVCLADISRNAATGNTYVFLTRSLRRMGRHSEAVDYGQRGMRAFPREYRILEAMGQSFFFLGNYEQSLAHMERYSNLLPGDDSIALAYFFMGEIFRNAGNFHRADIAYTTAMYYQPEMPLWWFRLGSVRERTGDRGPAMEAYRRALALSPAYTAARTALTALETGTGAN